MFPAELVADDGHDPAGRVEEREPSTTRARIAAAARESFALAGYSGTSTKDVARRAGVTSGSVFHHFGSKRALFAEVYADAHEELLATFEAAVEGETDPVAALDALISAATELNRSDRLIALFSATCSIDIVRNPELAEVVDARLLGRTTSLIARIVGERPDARGIVDLLATIVGGLAYAAVLGTTERHEALAAACRRALPAMLEVRDHPGAGGHT